MELQDSEGVVVVEEAASVAASAVESHPHRTALQDHHPNTDLLQNPQAVTVHHLAYLQVTVSHLNHLGLTVCPDLQRPATVYQLDLRLRTELLRSHRALTESLQALMALLLVHSEAAAAVEFPLHTEHQATAVAVVVAVESHLHMEPLVMVVAAVVEESHLRTEPQAMAAAVVVEEYHLRMEHPVMVAAAVEVSLLHTEPLAMVEAAEAVAAESPHPTAPLALDLALDLEEAVEFHHLTVLLATGLAVVAAAVEYHPPMAHLPARMEHLRLVHLEAEVHLAHLAQAYHPLTVFPHLDPEDLSVLAVVFQVHTELLRSVHLVQVESRLHMELLLDRMVEVEAGPLIRTVFPYHLAEVDQDLVAQDLEAADHLQVMVHLHLFPQAVMERQVVAEEDTLQEEDIALVDLEDILLVALEDILLVALEDTLLADPVDTLLGADMVQVDILPEVQGVDIRLVVQEVDILLAVQGVDIPLEVQAEGTALEVQEEDTALADQVDIAPADLEVIPQGVDMDLVDIPPVVDTDRVDILLAVLGVVIALVVPEAIAQVGDTPLEAEEVATRQQCQLPSAKAMTPVADMCTKSKFPFLIHVSGG
ncbi:uncharacterized protein LOC112050754 isoform X2 [Bicyclus anynana]|uniref:Uncharacterized protein LOC112050754 isoform X2 n=1 Tax=Bicyclus anynana TaxID=110368 RepID=A0ABM3LL50_BICAN|nr:uncharacterized protein LOC112050754 isoform X2 [Bicyclus anynana]